MNMRTLLLPLGCAVLLSACTYSVDTLKKDEDLRRDVLKDCMEMGLDAKDEQNCINAAKAEAEVTGESIRDFFD